MSLLVWSAVFNRIIGQGNCNMLQSSGITDAPIVAGMSFPLLAVYTPNDFCTTLCLDIPGLRWRKYDREALDARFVAAASAKATGMVEALMHCIVERCSVLHKTGTGSGSSSRKRHSTPSVVFSLTIVMSSAIVSIPASVLLEVVHDNKVQLFARVASTTMLIYDISACIFP